MQYFLICALFNSILQFFIPETQQQPLRDIWLVGKGFLQISLGTLQTLRTEPDDALQGSSNTNAVNSTIQIPYIYQHYKVRPYYQVSSGDAEGTLHKLYNSVVQAINKEPRLPQYLLMFLDRDVILQLNYFQPGISFVLECRLAWLAKNID